MEAVKAGTSYDLIDPANGKAVSQLDARTVWDRMILGAWRTGEPGVFFVDEANRYNPVPQPRPLRGDEPLRRAAAPRLRRLQPRLHQRRLLCDRTERWIGTPSRRTSICRTHFLDNIIDVNKYPLEEIDALSKRIRRIGLGVMGFADALRPARHRVRHGRGRGVRPQGDGVRRRRGQEGIERLAGDRGPFAEWAKSIWGPDETCARDENGKRIRPMQLLRNCNVTTVAPTGTISIIAGCSSGLEPLFAVAFMRNQAGVMMPDVNEDFVAIAKAEGWYSDELMERIAKTGSVEHPKCPRSGSASSSPRTRSRPSGTSRCRLPSRSTATRRFPRLLISRTPRPSKTCARSTSSRMT